MKDLLFVQQMDEPLAQLHYSRGYTILEATLSWRLHYPCYYTMLHYSGGYTILEATLSWSLHYPGDYTILEATLS